MSQPGERDLAPSDLLIRLFDAPSDWLTDIAQGVGFHAWRKALLSTRDYQEITHVYDPHNPKRGNQKLLKQKMDMAANVGRFRAAVAVVGRDTIGLAWASEAVSPTRLARALNWVRGAEPDVRLEEINVLPEYQSRGIGSAMLYELLSRYDEHQKIRADVLAELSGAIGWLSHRGFKHSTYPIDQNHMFGEARKPVSMDRMIAPSVEHVQSAIFDRGILRTPAYELIGEHLTDAELQP